MDSLQRSVAMFASDLDGTLFRTDHTVSDATRAALADAERAGVLVVLATGRPPRWMQSVAEQTGHRGVAVCSNGALLYDLHTEQILHAHLLQPDELREVVDALTAELGPAAIALETTDGFRHEPAYRHDWEVGRTVEIDDRSRILDVPAMKLLVKNREVDPDEFLAQAQQILGDRAMVTSSSAYGLLEISAAGVTKASGLAALAHERGLPADAVVAVGDMPNDLPMLAWAGHGVAVANAHPAVQAAADEILELTNDDDAVATLLRRYI